MLVTNYKDQEEDANKDKIITALADCLYYNANLTLGKLLSMSCLEYIFVNWIKMIYINNEKGSNNMHDRRYFKSLRAKKVGLVSLSEKFINNCLHKWLTQNNFQKSIYLFG